MQEYIFESQEARAELRRLQLIQEAFDPRSQDWLQRFMPATGGSALEVGAGGGSLASYLARVEHGLDRVVVLDRNTRFVRHLDAHNVEIVEDELLSYTGGPFDLIHVRYVLTHNRSSGAMLEHLRGLLKPGGWVVMEEPDFGASRWFGCAESRYEAAGNRVCEAIRQGFRERELEPNYGALLPRKAVEAGFTVHRYEADLHLEPGQAPVARVMASSAEALQDVYVGTGCATREDVNIYIEGASNPSVWAYWYATVRVSAQLADEA